MTGEDFRKDHRKEQGFDVPPGMASVNITRDVALCRKKDGIPRGRAG